MNSPLLFFAIEFAAQTAVLTAALLLMIKLQSLDFNWPGLIGSAALASALDMIPFFGHYLAVPVLYLCIWKVTHADLYPDAIFTVVIAYALMFCASMFLLAGLGPDLRHSANDKELDDDELTEMMKELSRTNMPGTSQPPPAQGLPLAGTANPSGTNITRASNPVPTMDTATKAAVAAEKAALEKARTLTLRGVTKGTTRSTAVVHSGVASYTLVQGEMSSMRIPSGVITVLCEEVGDDSVVLKLDGARVKLVIR